MKSSADGVDNRTKSAEEHFAILYDMRLTDLRFPFLAMLTGLTAACCVSVSRVDFVKQRKCRLLEGST